MELRFRQPPRAGVNCDARCHSERRLQHDSALRRTPGRLRRVLGQAGFPTEYPLDGRIREKHAVTAHLPKGGAAHRRRKSVPTVPAPA